MKTKEILGGCAPIDELYQSFVHNQKKLNH